VESPYREAPPALPGPPDPFLVAWSRLQRLRRRERITALVGLILMTASAVFAKPLIAVVFVGSVIVYFPTMIAITRFRCPRCSSFFHGTRRSFVPEKACDTCGTAIGTPGPPGQLDE
jgi:hypothetical protein